MINEKDLKTIFNKPKLNITTYPSYHYINVLDKDLYIYVLNDNMYKSLLKKKDIKRKNCYVKKSFTKTLHKTANKTAPKIFIHESLIRQKIRQNVLNQILF